LIWGAPAPNTGGAVITYVVVFDGGEYPVGLATTISGTVPPGRYLLGVFARNAAGQSAVATCEVTVGGPAAQETYSGSFSGTGTISRSGDLGTCTWQETYQGTITLTLMEQSGGLTGSIRVNGTASGPAGTSNSPDLNCLAGSVPFDSTNPVIISGTNFARSGIAMYHSTGTFSGNRSGSTVSGTISAKYNNGTGNTTIPVTLTKR
jgi:hypothetical protein